jgi:hypothetical protein
MKTPASPVQRTSTLQNDEHFFTMVALMAQEIAGTELTVGQVHQHFFDEGHVGVVEHVLLVDQLVCPL